MEIHPYHPLDQPLIHTVKTQALTIESNMSRVLRVVLLLVVYVSLGLSGTQVKITLPPGSLSHLQKRKTGACSDYTRVSKSTLSFPPGFQSLPKPWRNAIVTVVRSPAVTNGMNTMFSLNVPGLNGKTIKDVLDKFRQQGCLCFPFGGSVRDQFLEQTPNDLDMDVSCTVKRIRDICTNNWGNRNCKYSARVVHIGNKMANDGTTDEIDSAPWNKNFFGRHDDLEYTTNTLAFDPNGNNVVIDLPGNGVQDTCNKKIRIPVRASQWNIWSEENYPNKIFRFWKLRTKGYTAVDISTLQFIVNKAEIAIMNSPLSFKKFYCKTVLGGTTSADTCTISDCNSAVQSATKYNSKFNEDMGTFWSDTAKPLVANYIQNCTSGTGNSMYLGAVKSLICMTVATMLIFL